MFLKSVVLARQIGWLESSDWMSLVVHSDDSHHPTLETASFSFFYDIHHLYYIYLCSSYSTFLTLFSHFLLSSLLCPSPSAHII